MLAHERKGITLAINAASLERPDVRQLLPAISAPTLVICGTADRATPVELREEVAAGIRGAQLKLLPEVGHHAPIEAPAQVSDALVQFLARAEVNTPPA